VIAALSAAGLQSRTFRFLGFLPREAGPLGRLFASLTQSSDTVVAFESPNRLPRTLRLLAEAMPWRRIAVCRELTKMHEEVFVGTPAEALAHFGDTRGEVVLVIEGGEPSPAAIAGDEAALRADIRLMRELGLTQAQTAALLQRRYQMPRRRLYQLWLEP